jgi:hypothetical protein
VYGQCLVSMRVPHADGGDCHAPAQPELTLLVGPWACKAVDLVQVPAKTLDHCHLVRWCLLDSVNGISERKCGLQDAISSCYDRDRDCMMLIAEHVRDAFTPSFFCDDINATVVGGSMGEVPYFGGMITPCFASARFLKN